MGRLRAQCKDLFEISDLERGTHNMMENMAHRKEINCDFELKENQDLYVYMRLDSPVIGHSLAETNYGTREPANWFTGWGVGPRLAGGFSWGDTPAMWNAQEQAQPISALGLQAELDL